MNGRHTAHVMAWMAVTALRSDAVVWFYGHRSPGVACPFAPIGGAA